VPENVDKRYLLRELFPEGSQVLLTGSGKQFIERIGVEATKRAILNVMLGKNLREETEPLTRRRVAQINGAIVALFLKGGLSVPDFANQLTTMALKQINSSRKSDKVSVWPALWAIGLTGKADQNVVRNNPDSYVQNFEAAVEQAVNACRAELGDIEMNLGYVADPRGGRTTLDWRGIIRLMTSIGSQTLAIRGSDKSIYGKLFEKLILGSFLTILGFERVDKNNNRKPEGVFWLSDSSRGRESDATLIARRGKVAQFDIGFIGQGNPEISSDKLSRFERDFERAGQRMNSVTFVIVDKLPARSIRTREVAKKVGAEIVQMSMQHWTRYLAQRLKERLDIEHELQDMPDEAIEPYLSSRLATVPVEDFLTGVSLQEVEEINATPELDDGVEEPLA
jgi:hypothetical protein